MNVVHGVIEDQAFVLSNTLVQDRQTYRPSSTSIHEKYF